MASDAVTCTSNSRPSKYPPEFRKRCVRAARESDGSISAVVGDLGVHPEILRLWMRADEAADGTRGERLGSAEREELTALRREVLFTADGGVHWREQHSGTKRLLLAIAAADSNHAWTA